MVTKGTPSTALPVAVEMAMPLFWTQVYVTQVLDSPSMGVEAAMVCWAPIGTEADNVGNVRSVCPHIVSLWEPNRLLPLLDSPAMM